jgi:hypothetical protein
MIDGSLAIVGKSPPGEAFIFFPARTRHIKLKIWYKG